MKRLVNQELLTPLIELNLTMDNWPDSYMVKIDSSPYYGNKKSDDTVSVLGADGFFHPSSHCIPGARYLYYLMHPEHHIERERKTLVSAMTLAFGSAVHAIMQAQFKMIGLCEDKDIEIELQNNEHWWRGHMDCLIHHPNGKNYPIDIKTMNSRSFAMVKEAKPTWKAQLNCYMDEMGLDEGLILVVESGYPFAMKEFRIYRDDELLSNLYAKWDYVRECITANTPPSEKCCALDSPTMAKCPAREICLQTY